MARLTLKSEKTKYRRERGAIPPENKTEKRYRLESMPHDQLCVGIDEQNSSAAVHLYLCNGLLCTIDLAFPVIKLYSVDSYSDTVSRCVNRFITEFCGKSLRQVYIEAVKELGSGRVSTRIDVKRVMFVIKWYHENGKKIL